MKKELIAANLTLTDNESTRLWQVYEQYAADMGKINDTRTAILKDYSEQYDTLSYDQADNLIRRWLSAVRVDLSESLTWKKSCDLPSTGAAHQLDDGCATYIATSVGPEPQIPPCSQISCC